MIDGLKQTNSKVVSGDAFGIGDTIIATVKFSDDISLKSPPFIVTGICSDGTPTVTADSQLDSFLMEYFRKALDFHLVHTNSNPTWKIKTFHKHLSMRDVQEIATGVIDPPRAPLPRMTRGRFEEITTELMQYSFRLGRMSTVDAREIKPNYNNQRYIELWRAVGGGDEC